MFNLCWLFTDIRKIISNLSGQDIPGQRSLVRCGTRNSFSTPKTQPAVYTRHFHHPHCCKQAKQAQLLCWIHEPECVGGEGRPLHSVSRCTMSKQGRLFYCASVPLSCLELKAAVQVRNLQGSMLTMFKLSPDLAQCCSREQANNQALAAYREACQGLPAVAWGCKCDFG